MASQQQHPILQKAPSSSQAITVVTLFPLGGILLTLSGLTLTITVIGLTAVSPLFLLFSPVLAPAVGLVGFALAGFFVSGAAGVAGMLALSWVFRACGTVFSKERLEGVRVQMAEGVGQVGQQTKEVGQGIQSRAHESERSSA